MSFLRLRLPPARKAWKSFTSKLQSKLRKLNKAKAIKKPRNRHPSTLAIKQRIQRNKNGLRPYDRGVRFRYHRRYLFKKKAEPVYIDRLFKEPITEVVTKKVVKSVDNEKEGGGNGGAGTSSVGDDMWEALGLASPQMNEIDRRAEDFIRRFRAEMHHQEMTARRL